MSGPVPKRSSERRRRNKPEVPITHAPSKHEPVWPGVDTQWHPIAADLYKSLQVSGQSQFYEQSDIQFAVLAAEVTSKCLAAQRLNGAVIATVVDLWGSLLATEADRRRLRVELERQAPEEPASVLILDKYRKAVQ